MLQAAPDSYNQPLTRWGHLWRLLGCLLVSTIAWWEIVDRQWLDHRGWFWIDLSVGVASYWWSATGGAGRSPWPCSSR
ncbi:MAG: hypothetical protein EOO67_11235 [Microbacterium sp.]|nr:MAG: hypothetical protein EOO67_11235 [Microbacterium sp.]